MNIHCLLLAEYALAHIPQYVFVAEPANHRHQATLHTNEAEQEHKWAECVVVPCTKMIDSQINNHTHTSNQFNLGRNQAWRVGLIKSENLNANYVDYPLENAECSHRHSEHRDTVAKEERHYRNGEDKHGRDESASEFGLYVEVTLKHIRLNKVQEPARKTTLFPLVQYAQKRHPYGRLLNNRQSVHKHSN